MAKALTKIADAKNTNVKKSDLKISLIEEG